MPTSDDANRDGLSRRAFGQLLGAAALTAALPDVSHGAPSRSPPPAEDLCDLTAVDLAARIARVNPKINAVVTLVADRAMADATKADEWQARGSVLGPLHGL